MNKKIFYMLILITGVLAANMMAGSANAQTTPEISYPVAELGNCADKAACKVYCDESANIDACLSFAEKNNLMSKDEIKVAKNFKSTGMTGPGGCKGKDECGAYCNGPDHMDACIAFAEKNGMMSGSQLEEAKKVQGAIAKGIKPPACGGKDACNTYCSSKEHMSECVNFAESAGMISKEEADKIRNQGDKNKGPEGQQGQDKKGPNGEKKGPADQQGGQGQSNGKQRPPQEQRQGQGQGGQGNQNNGGSDQGGQQRSQGPDGQQGPGGPGGQDQNQGQNQGGPENGGQSPTTN